MGETYDYDKVEEKTKSDQVKEEEIEKERSKKESVKKNRTGNRHRWIGAGCTKARGELV